MLRCTLRYGVGRGKRWGMRADVGKELNLSVVAGAGSVVRLRPLAEDESRVETAGKSFYAELRTVGGDKKAGSVGVTYSKERDVVLTLPEMGVGQYMLVVEMSASSGARERFVSGWVTYMEPSALVKPKVDSSPDRLIGVVMDGERRRAVWYHTTAAEVYAERAEKAAETAERVQNEIEAVLDEAVEEATERAEAAAVQAAASAASAKADAASAKADRQAIEVKFQETDAFIDGFYDVALRVIVPNQTTGTWWIGGRDSKQPFQGEQGYSPQISTSGYWLVWRDGQVVESDTRAMAEDGFSPYIDSAGYWVYVDPLTGQVGRGPLAAGKDGLDGTAVRRILVSSVEDIPTEGDTCHGGVYYYVKDTTAGAGESVDIHITNWSSWLLYFTASDGLQGSLGGLRNMDSLVNDVNTGSYSFTAEKVDENVVRLHPKQVAMSVQVGFGCRVLTGGAYEVYGWIEQGDTAGWLRLGMASDLATAEVHGLVKLGTNSIIQSGSPVGNNADGQMAVSVASYTSLGTVKPSGTAVSDDGGGTHMAADGKMLVDKADTQRFGAVKLSCGEQIPNDDDNIGLRADGKIGVRRATLDEFGSVRLGSKLQQVANIPYLLSVGSITDETRPGDTGKLANNLLLGGALQHQTASYWTSGGRLDIDGIDSANLKSGVYYMGLYTSPSFKQSEENGLELKEATTTLLGGVKKQTTLASGGDVPTGSAVLNYLNLHYYNKLQTYSQDELTKDGGVIEEVLSTKLLPIYAAQQLAPYAKTAWVNENFAKASELNTVKVTVADNKSDIAANTNSIGALQSELNGIKAEVQEMLKDYVKVGNSGIYELCELTQEEFDKLSVIDTKKSYIVLANG